ncbi:DUF1304 domain-containing protein [Periweissella ghanensis]|uniref:DUF1304 domain-containing protein n=1 Tax=Periweissella ghanensis TaxID=467997 RepID=A0ABM8ZBH2_9LACO|nr:DUF1304 domain-containing protein [Periweissella ghanensis]MCM0601848.1 DUF1304 domain-containing protein [Periweissella ghanensis]CAH0418835.1 hypothetical protein WGH24286_01277 [Periweissella ghanensis]
MSLISIIFATIVGVEAFGIMLMEMFFSPAQLAKEFDLPNEFTAQHEAKVLMANQGLYNGFVAVMTLLSVYLFPTDARYMATLACIIFVVIAAIFGAISGGKPKILLMQGTPAIVTLIILLVFK